MTLKKKYHGQTMFFLLKKVCLFFFLQYCHQWCVVAVLGDEVTPFDNAGEELAGDERLEDIWGMLWTATLCTGLHTSRTYGFDVCQVVHVFCDHNSAHT